MSPAAVFPGVILAQGTSRRFAGAHGTDKGLALLGGEPLVALVAARLAGQARPLAINAPGSYSAIARQVGATRIDDAPWTGRGPLAGIRAGLAWASEVAPGAAHVLIAAVDMPFLPLDLADRLGSGLSSTEAAIACTPAGSAIPVLGLWPLAALATVEALVADGTNLAVHAAIDRLSWRPVVFSDTELSDIDDADAMVEAEARLAAMGRETSTDPGRL